VIGDERFVIFSETITREKGAETREKYLACIYGENGIQAEDGLPEPWDAGWGGVNVELLVAAGPYLAWQNAGWTNTDGEPGTYLNVLDVPEDKVLVNKVMSTAGSNPYQPSAHALALALDSEGHVAWRATKSIPRNPGSIETIEDEAVEAIGEDGQTLILESGAVGSFGALSFEPAGTLHWSSHRTARTYTFSNAAGA
jgi:hypothetical protein